MIHHQDDHLTIHIGDCREVMRTLPAESIHTVVTSPPYWGLRDYGTASWAGGDADCDHLGPPRNQSDTSTLGVYADGTSRYKEGWKPELQSKQIAMGTPYKATCGKCGATRIDIQLGLEPTPEAFIAAMVDVFREVKRVLRKDGTLWLNMGDSYNSRLDGSHGGWNGSTPTPQRVKNDGAPVTISAPGLKTKDLVGMPWRLAFALQADGWYLRSDIIWAKPNPMPESVTDRPTKSHEYVFLLTKSARYYYDAEAVREPHAYDWTDNAAAMHRQHLERRARIDIPGNGIVGRGGRDSQFSNGPNPAGRNLRSVWQIATEPYPGAHFATFPQKLVEPCIKAGTSERGVCPECGAPWVREVKATTTGWRPTCAGHLGLHHIACAYFDRPYSADPDDESSCNCDRRPVPATVLDPFAGSGTTGLVANRLGRRAILIDLSADYIDQAMLRNQQHPLGLIG